MRTFFFVACLIVSTYAMAQNGGKNDIPIIDRSIFFGNPEITGGKLSPDGTYLSFLKEYNGILNIWVKKFDEPFTSAKRITDLERPAGGYFWTLDGKYILYLKDKGGNENYNIYAVNTANFTDGRTIPPSRNLTPNDSALAVIYMVSKKDPNVLMIGLNDRDPKWHDLYKLEINSGKLTKVKGNFQRISSWVFDWNEQPRMAIVNPEDGSTEFLSIEGNNFNSIYKVTALETAWPVAFTKDNSKVYVVTNKGADVNLSKLALMDPATGRIEDVEKDPLNRVDIEDVIVSDYTKELQATTYNDEKIRYYFKDKKLEGDYNFLQSKFPGAEIYFNSSTKDETKTLITISGDTRVADVYFFDRNTKQLIHQYTPRPKLKPFEKYLCEVKPIRYKSSDGLEIPAYLTLPKNTTGKVPLLVVPHGGPWARSTWGFSSIAQLFANRGFAVLDPNFRGSTGYGKKFLDAGNLQWGKLMQDDITWGIKHLINAGTVDAGKVAILGGSYGGYATLAGLAFTPDVYKCGVDIVGPSNLFTLLNSIPPYWESFKKQFLLRMGDNETDEGKAILKNASPLFSAEKIKAPLMIIQGANDPRVKKAESDQIVIALRELKRDVTYILANDEGHGFAKPINNMALFAAAEKFLAKYCNTRYQQDMPADVAKRLSEMTVNINTVQLAKKTDIKPDDKLPQLTGDLQKGEFSYSMEIDINGQKIPMETSRQVVEKDGNWHVIDDAKSPMGESSDEVVYKKNSLSVIKRSASQGALRMNMINNGTSVTVTGVGNDKKIDIKGLYLPDASGLDMIIARMPLQDGFTFACSTIDELSMAAKPLQIKVVGKEIYKSAECWKVAIINLNDPNEKTEMWIDPVKKMAVKTVKILPALNNAVITIELK